MGGDFRIVERPADFGLIMHSALEIDLDSSATAYADWHHNWQHRVDEETRWLAALAPDLVLADVPYLTLAAAGQARIPAVALCCLNWADIYRHYFSGRSEAGEVLAHMESAYRSARAFLCPEPSMPMDFLDNRVSIAPLAAQGVSRRDAINDRLQLDDDQTLVLVAPGGINMRFAMEGWPGNQGIHWLVSEHWNIEHPDASSLECTGFTFTDLVSSCDAVLGKIGYGTVSECVVNGTPLMYVPRPDWPEELPLLQWLKRHRAAVEVAPYRLVSGDFGAPVRQAKSLAVKVCQPEGARQAADFLFHCLH